MNDVSLLAMLNAREMRAKMQIHMIREFQQPLICLTLNIPGSVKVFDGIPGTFFIGCLRIEELLAQQSIRIADEFMIKEHTGYEAFYSVDGDADTIKRWMIAIEDQDKLGRLFDIDVLRTDGTKVSREDLGYPARSCLLCDEAAHNCSRSRRHSVADLLSYIETLVAENCQEG